MPVTKECRCCRKPLYFPPTVDVLECDACGTLNERPVVEGIMLDNFRRAICQQNDRDFYNAEKSYQYVLNSCPDNAEALWNRLLCHYGAVYVNDNGKRLWEVRMAKRTPLQEQGDFLRACQLAKPEVRAQYEEDAAYIDRAMTRLFELAEHCPPYDIFLCHKTRMPEGGYTEDFRRASDLYELLTKKGYRVFFAPKSLESEAGESYEAGICHALDTAKVMLVLCSKPEFLTSIWVQSEWQRYIEKIDNGEKKCLIPLLYDGFKSNRLPAEFNRRSIQGIVMDIKAEEKVLLNVRKHLRPKRGVIVRYMVLLLAAAVLLAAGAGAIREFRGGHDGGNGASDPVQLSEHAKLYEGRNTNSYDDQDDQSEGLTAQQLPSPSPSPSPVPDRITASVSGTGNNRRIVVEANGSWTAVSDSWINLSPTWGGPGHTSIDVWLSENPSMSASRSGRVVFTRGSENCAVTIWQDAAPTPTPSPTPTPTPTPTPVPDRITASVSGTGDTRRIVVEANGSWTAVSDSWINLSPTWGGPGHTSVDVWLSENPSRSASRSGRVVFTRGSESCTVTIWQDANPALYDSSDFWVGNTVGFGHYEQDGWSSNGKEEIRWRVLDRSGNYALLLSDRVLDSKAYVNANSSIQVNWANCSLRTWLNSSFLQDAFSAEERNAIRTTQVSTPPNPGYETDPGPDTQDQVFLLSYQECQRYLGSTVAYPTQYAINRGVMVRQDMGGLTYWWLRSTHSYGKVSIINTSGKLYGSKTNDSDGGVRPAIWVDLSNRIFD